MSMQAYTGDAADSRTPGTAAALGIPLRANAYSSTATGLQAMNPQALGIAGGSLPHNNMQPYLTMNFCIAMQGIFPPRS